MSDHAEQFVAHLLALKGRDRGALAALRHSLAFDPGTYPKAFPYVERFAGNTVHERDARRLALYAVAGLFARHPQQASQSLASALGELQHRRDSSSIEGRFIALLGADSENVVDYLRQAISLLAADGVGCDYLDSTFKCNTPKRVAQSSGARCVLQQALEASQFSLLNSASMASASTRQAWKRC